MSGFIAPYLPAAGAFVSDNITAFRVRLGFDGNHQSAAIVASISRQNVQMEGAKAARTMVSRGVPERFDNQGAVLANKSAVIF